MPSDPDGIALLGLDFAALDLAAVLRLLGERPAGAPFAAVVTPNADHLVRLAQRPDLLPLYQGAWLRLLDSRVVARVARGFGLAAPPVVPGSDLTAALFGQVIRPEEPVTVLGGEPAVLAAVQARYGLTRLAHHNPPMGFDRDPEAIAHAIGFIEANPARFTWADGKVTHDSLKLKPPANIESLPKWLIDTGKKLGVHWAPPHWMTLSLRGNARKRFLDWIVGG